MLFVVQVLGQLLLFPVQLPRQVAQGGCGDSFLGDPDGPAGCGSGQPALGGPG